MTPAWQNPGISLGLRCLLWSREQKALGIHAPRSPAPNTSPVIAGWLAACLRDVDGDGDLEPLGIKEGNWCAAFASAAMIACLLPGEVAPHERRAGVVEIEADARKRGLWHDVEEVRLGAWTPSAGDLVIWDRSDPTKPDTSWWRHVNRLVRFTDGHLDRLVTIGGNENRQIVETSGAPKALDSSRLLGFVSYYQKPSASHVDPEERARLDRLIAGFIEAHRRTL